MYSYIGIDFKHQFFFESFVIDRNFGCVSRSKDDPRNFLETKSIAIKKNYILAIYRIKIFMKFENLVNRPLIYH